MTRPIAQNLSAASIRTGSRIHDARPIERSFSIEQNGFELLRRPTAVTDFSDAEQVKKIYHAEIERLIKERTGAETVLIFGPALRTDSPSRGADVRQPATAPHVDYSEKMVRYFIRDMLGEAEAERLASRRFMLINVWRPLVTVERSPLALCDAATVKRDDLVLAYVKGSVASKAGEEPLVVGRLQRVLQSGAALVLFPAPARR